MLRLTATTEKLQAVLAGAVATTQPQAVVCFSDQTATGYSGGKQVTSLNSTTDVDILAAPLASTIRDVDYLGIFNRDTASVTVTIKYDISATDSIIITVTLLTLETLEYTHGSGWKVLTSTGAIKVPVSAVSPAGASGDIQYNNGSAFGAESAFNYNSTSNTLAVDNITIGTGGTVPTAAESDNDTSIASTAFVNANQAGSWSHINNTSKNNSTTPDTQFDLTADVVVLRNTSNHVVVRYAPGTITNNVSTAGSTANGRDQAGAFSASSWIHFYWIWNGTTLATLSSAVAPTTGPTLPSGYTHWAYCGAVRFGAGSTMPKVRMRGEWVFQEARTVPLNNGSATSETSVDISAFIPPNALEYQIETIMTETTNGAGVFDVASALRIVSGSNFWNAATTMNGLGLSSAQISPPAVMRVPNVGQAFLYINTNTTGSVTFTVVMHGYRVPNGGA